MTRAKKRHWYKALISDPDSTCIYCGLSFDRDKLDLPTGGEYSSKKARRNAHKTLEHLKAKSLGGTDRKDNIYLAHKLCNTFVGNICVNMKRRLFGKLEPNFVEAKMGIKTITEET